MRKIAILIVLSGFLLGCGGEPASYPECQGMVGESVQYQECGGKRLDGIYCVTDCIHAPGDQSSADTYCTMPVFGPPEQTGICVNSCDECH